MNLFLVWFMFCCYVITTFFFSLIKRPISQQSQQTWMEKVLFCWMAAASGVLTWWTRYNFSHFSSSKSTGVQPSNLIFWQLPNRRFCVVRQLKCSSVILIGTLEHGLEARNNFSEGKEKYIDSYESFRPQT